MIPGLQKTPSLSWYHPRLICSGYGDAVKTHQVHHIFGKGCPQNYCSDVRKSAAERMTSCDDRVIGDCCTFQKRLHLIYYGGVVEEIFSEQDRIAIAPRANLRVRYHAE
jgi:hypothetical protein